MNSIGMVSLTQGEEADVRKRGSVLRKLLVKLHPDQNRGREEVGVGLAKLSTRVADLVAQD